MEKKVPTVKKTYDLTPALIARIRRIFKAKTDTEAIILALREMTFMEEVGRAHRTTSGEIPNFKPLR